MAVGLQASRKPLSLLWMHRYLATPLPRNNIFWEKWKVENASTKCFSFSIFHWFLCGEITLLIFHKSARCFCRSASLRRARHPPTWLFPVPCRWCSGGSQRRCWLLPADLEIRLTQFFHGCARQSLRLRSRSSAVKESKIPRRQTFLPVNRVSLAGIKNNRCVRRELM